MDKLTIDDFKKMLRNALVCITERSDEFSKLDAVLGDGDHGTAIVQSMSALVATADKGTEFKSMLNDMSFNLMLEISGSTSTLMGGFVLGMSAHDVKAILTAGAEAAVKGAEATKDMKANFGRARNYGERSIGYADSGASSWSCMFDAFAKAL